MPFDEAIFLTLKFSYFFNVDFACVCGKTYTTARILKRHQKQCPEAGGVKIAIPCGIINCNMILSSENARRRHIKKVHLGERNRHSIAQTSAASLPLSSLQHDSQCRVM